MNAFDIGGHANSYQINGQNDSLPGSYDMERVCKLYSLAMERDQVRYIYIN